MQQVSVIFLYFLNSKEAKSEEIIAFRSEIYFYEGLNA